MKENISMAIAVLAIVFATVAVTTSFVKTSDFSIGAGTISGNELASNSVTGDNIVDDTITDDDISDSGLSKFADGSITLADLTSEVLAEMSGVVEILDNSILGSKLANASISNRHIVESAEIDPSKIQGTAWTAENDGSGSGLNADTLDGINSNNFVRADIEKTGYFTIPYCGFMPFDSDTPYSLAFRVLRNTDPAFASHYYYAPIYLPDGAKVTKITVRYEKDDVDANCYVYLSEGGESSNTLLVTIDLPYTTSFQNYSTSVAGVTIRQNMPYRISMRLIPNDSSYDVQIAWVCIEYSYTV